MINTLHCMVLSSVNKFSKINFEMFVLHYQIHVFWSKLNIFRKIMLVVNCFTPYLFRWSAGPFEVFFFSVSESESAAIFERKSAGKYGK